MAYSVSLLWSPDAESALSSILLPWQSQAASLGVFLTNPNRMGIQAEVILGSGQFKDRTHG